MFLAANLKEVSEPRATVPKSCFVSENIFFAQASAKHGLAVAATAMAAAARIRTRMEPNPPECASPLFSWPLAASNPAPIQFRNIGVITTIGLIIDRESAP